MGKHFLTTSNLRVSISSSVGIKFRFWQLGLSSMARICGTNLVGAVDLCNDAFYPFTCWNFVGLRVFAAIVMCLKWLECLRFGL